MKRGLRSLLLLSAFCSLASLASGDANVSAEARVLKDRVRIGDDVRLLLLVEHPRKYSVTPPSEKMSLAPFEIKHVETESLKKGQNRIQETFRLTLTVFQTGELKVPAISVRYTDDSGKPGLASTEPVLVKVMSVGKKLTDKDDIRPIKPPVSSGVLNFWSTLGVLIAAGLFIFLITKIVLRKIREQKDAESRKPPQERAQIELKRLKDHGYLEEKNYKAFYSELSDILRRYLERRFRVEALELTSAELLEELKKRSFEKEVLDDIREVLTEADLVKFARSVPSYEQGGRLETLLLDAVERTKPRPEEKKK